jgi:SHS2 domain-containing protein
MASYEVFATTADAGIRFRGRDFAELYRHSLAGLNLLLFGADRRRPRRGQARDYRYHGDGPESVLVNFLSEVLFLTYHRGQRVAAIEIRCAGRAELEAGMLLVPWRKAPRVDVKAVTYHGLRVGEEQGQLSAAVVFDL